jgi:hypothetical protein
MNFNRFIAWLLLLVSHKLMLPESISLEVFSAKQQQQYLVDSVAPKSSNL